MGTRGVVRIHSGDMSKCVTLYQHYDSYDLPQTVATALGRGTDRWGDPSYLARIVFSEMVRDSLDGTTGYGIFAGPVDCGQEVEVIIDTRASTISVGGSSAKMSDTTGGAPRPIKEWLNRMSGGGGVQEALLAWLDDTRDIQAISARIVVDGPVRISYEGDGGLAHADFSGTAEGLLNLLLPYAMRFAEDD